MGVNKELIEFLENVDLKNATEEELRADLLDFKGRGADFSYVLNANSPLKIAIERNSIDLFRLIYSIGNANLDQVLGEKEESLVHIATYHEADQILSFMIENNVNLKVYDAKNSDPAFCAASLNCDESLKILLEGMKLQLSSGEFREVLFNAAAAGAVNEHVNILKTLISFGLSLQDFQNYKIEQSGDRTIAFLRSVKDELRYFSICHNDNLQIGDFKFIKKFRESGNDISEFIDLIDKKIFGMPLSQISCEPLFSNYPAFFNSQNIGQYFSSYLEGEIENDRNTLRMLFSALFAIRNKEVEIQGGTDKFLINLLKIAGILPQKYGFGEATSNSMKEKYPQVEEFDDLLKIIKIPASKNYGIMLLTQKTFENQELAQKLETYLNENPQFEEKLFNKLEQIKQIIWPSSNSIEHSCNLLIDRLKRRDKLSQIENSQESHSEKGTSSGSEISSSDSSNEKERGHAAKETKKRRQAKNRAKEKA